MAAQLTYPGVYVQEEPSGAQAVAAASTSTALFVGMANRGTFGTPFRVLSLIAYEREFGATSPGELADQVRQFYVNGGTEAWIMRIANGAAAAAVTLRNEQNDANALILTARDVGAAGNSIRAEVDYDTADPDRTFNLILYRNTLLADGTFRRDNIESYNALSMDPGAARYAPNIVTGVSTLVNLADPAPTAVNAGASVGGLVYLAAPAGAALASVQALRTATANSFRVAIGNNPPVTAVLPANPTLADIGTAIVNAYQAIPIVVTATATFVALPGNTGRVLQITSTSGAVTISPAASNDIAVALMLGTANGGVELDSSTPRRPAPTGITSRLGTIAGAPDAGWLAAVTGLGNENRNQIATFTLTDPSNPAGDHAAQPIVLSGAAADPIFRNAAPAAGAPIGSLTNIRTALGEIAASIAANTGNRWTARRAGLRIIVAPTFGGSDVGMDSRLTTTVFNIGQNLATRIFRIPANGDGASNVRAFSLGRTGALPPAGLKQVNAPADTGSDGTMPQLVDYQAAFATIDVQLDSFNIMVLPRAEGQTNANRRGLWGIASALAAKKRAMLLVDPEDNWATIPAAETGVANLKVGVETRNAAIYWPRLTIPDANVPAGRNVDPSGSIAGLWARTDARFGVWTAPAGIEATVRGIVGLQRNMSDDENGVLNPKALNAIRLFPSGAVAWGARTMIGSDDTGNIDDKYIPVRRTMLFIEESLYRGLKFAVFRPNAEPLWASIRLAAGSFMNSLMRQGAFASRNKLEAYFVLCDATTTTATDINLGIVNVIVGFAPLKPAEFVVLTVKQIAGQVEV